MKPPLGTQIALTIRFPCHCVAVETSMLADEDVSDEDFAAQFADLMNRAMQSAIAAQIEAHAGHVAEGKVH